MQQQVSSFIEWNFSPDSIHFVLYALVSKKILIFKLILTMKNKVLLTNFTIFSLTRWFLFKIFLLIFIAHFFSGEQLYQSSVTYKTDTVCCSECFFCFFLIKTVKPLYCRKTFSTVRFTGSDISKHKSGQCAVMKHEHVTGITNHQF